MARKKGLPSYPGSRALYARLAVLSILEGFSILAQGIFLARAITFMFNGEPLSVIALDLVYFLIAIVSRQLIVQFEQQLSERFAEKTISQLRKQLVHAYFN